MKKWLYLTLFFLTAVFSEESLYERDDIAWLNETEPSSIVEGVHLLSGQFGFVETDYVIPGPQPLAIQRSYRGSTNPNHCVNKGVQLFGGYYLSYKEDRRKNKVIARPFKGKCKNKWEIIKAVEPSGTCFYYENNTTGASDFHFKMSKNKPGLTNTGSGEIGGASNYKNRRLEKVEDDVFEYLEDGTIRLYRTWDQLVQDGKCSDDKSYFCVPFPEDSSYGVDTIIHPSGNKSVFYYNKHHQVRRVETQNGDGHLLSFFFIEEDRTKEKRSKTKRSLTPLRIKTSDGKIFTYTPSINGKTISEISGPGVIPTSYEFKVIPGTHLNVLTRICYPLSQYTLIEYDENIDSPTLGYVTAIKSPIKAGANPVTKSKFEYHLSEKTPYVDVFGPTGSHKRYYYSPSHRIACIEFFDGPSICLKQRFFWGKGQDECNLVTKSIEDGRGIAHKVQAFIYDENGNVLEERLYGNISGCNHAQINIDENGAISTTADCLITKASYSRSPFNLKLSEDKGGKKTSFSYHLGTNLLASKYTWNYENTRILKREFFHYDKSANLTEIIEDDGYAPAENNLSGISFRKKRTIQIKQQQPGLGLPECIKEYGVDTKTELDKILSHKEFIYGIANKPIEEKVFNAKGILAHTTRYEYDEAGNCLFKEDPLGNRIRYTYDELYNLKEEHFLNANCLKQFDYDSANRAIRSAFIDPRETQKTDYTFDNNHNMTSSTDYLGNKTTYIYNSFDQLIAKELPIIRDKLSNAVPNREEYKRDIFGNIIEINHPDGFSTRKSYNVLGKVTKIEYPDGTQEIFEYNLDGSLKSHTNQALTTTFFEYDRFGNETLKLLKDVSKKIISDSSRMYSPFFETCSKDEMGDTTHYLYNNLGQLGKVVRENGSIEEYQYDDLGRHTSTMHFIGKDLQYSETFTLDALDREVELCVYNHKNDLQSKKTYSYDALGNKNSITTYGENGAEVRAQVCDFFGNTLSSKDPLGNEIVNTYDTSHKDSCSRSILRRISINPLGNQAVYSYDARGCISRVQIYSAAGALLQDQKNFYDSKGNLVHARQESLNDDPAFAVDHYYNGAGNLVKTVEAPDGGSPKVTQISYNKLGQVTQKIKPDSTSIYYNYFYDNAVSRIYSEDGSIDYHFEYDAKGRVISATDQERRTFTRNYDSNDNLICDLYGPVAIHKEFDSLGRKVRVSLPDSHVITYAHNGIFVTSASMGPFGQTIIKRRDFSGRILESQLPHSAGEIHKSYDLAGRVTSILAPYFSEQNTFDSVGRLTEKKTSDPMGPESISFKYDGIGQLIKEEGSFSHTYTYDAKSNRTSHNEDTFQYDALNKIVPSGDLNVNYSSCASLTSLKSKSKDLKLEYDALDRLIKLEAPGKFSYVFSYDPFNRRITQTYSSGQNSETVYFLYDNECEIGTVTPSGEIKQLRVLLEDVDVEIDNSYHFEMNGKAYVPIYDSRGNIAVLLKGTSPVFAYRYTGFGEKQVYNISYEKWMIPESVRGLCSYTAPPQDICPWHFSSKRSIPGTSISSFGYRDYDPEIARWLTPDPDNFGDGLNLYAYVHNNPLSNWDAFGLSTDSGLAQWGDTVMQDKLYSPLIHAMNKLEYQIARSMSNPLGAAIEGPLFQFRHRLIADPVFAKQVADGYLQYASNSCFQAPMMHFWSHREKYLIPLDIALDPITYLPGGVAKACGKLAKVTQFAIATHKIKKGFALNQIATKIERCAKAESAFVKGTSTIRAPRVAMEAKGAASAANQKGVQKAFVQIEEYLGSGSRAMTNSSKDPIFLSKDGLRRVRFDWNRPDPHKNPHMHIDIRPNARVRFKTRRIYGRDVNPE